MKNIFNIKRFSLLLRNLWIEQQQYLWLYLCANIILIGFVAIGTSAISSQAIVFTIGTAITIFMVVMSIKWYMSKRSMDYALLPASGFEKLLTILISLIAGIIGYILLFMLLNTIYNLISFEQLKTIQPINQQDWEFSLFSSCFVLNPIKWVLVGMTQTYNQALTYAISVATFIFCAFTFMLASTSGSKKHKMKNTFLALIIVGAITAINHFSNKIITSDMYSLPDCIERSDIQVVINAAATPPPIETLTQLSWGAAILFLIAAYFGLKEKEIQ